MATTLISPVVPNKRPRSDHSPTSRWPFHAHDLDSTRISSQDARWPGPGPWAAHPHDSSPARRDEPPPESWWLRPIDPAQPEAGLLPPQQPPMAKPGMSCNTCTKASVMVPRLASGVEELQAELSKLSVGGPEPRRREGPDASSNPKGLLQTLDWSLDRLNESVKVTREVIAKSNRDRASSAPWRPDCQAAHGMHGDMPRINSRMSPQAQEGGRRPPELPPLFTDDYRKTGGLEPTSAAPGSSPPPPSSQGSLPGQSAPANDGGRNRYPTLPSPATLSVSSVLLPPMSPSLQSGAARSPHTAHLEDLQHQLSTKTLAHQVLSGEHQKLLSAYSRLQIRCGALDKKSAVSDTEIANLAEDRIHLQADLEAADARVAELQAAQEESHKQFALNGDQYLQIMNMSSQLQARGAEEMRRWKADRDAWDAEREALLARIEDLEQVAARAHSVADVKSEAGTFVNADEEELAPQSDGSPRALHKEVLELRRRLRHEQELVRTSTEEGCKLNCLLRELGNIGQRLTGGPQTF